MRDPLAYVEVDPDTGCWYWPYRTSTGYGPFLSFFVAAFSEPPEGMDVFHLCRGGPFGCIRPSCLDVAPTGTKISRVRDPRIARERLPAFAERLRAERSARRITQHEFARQLGVSATVYGAWENARNAPTREAYREIAERLGWDGVLRRFAVLVALERVVEARSAGEAASAVLGGVEIDGQPHKAQVIRIERRR